MDWSTIKDLLEIVELSRGHPQLKAINDAALMELAQHASAPEEPVETEEGTSDE